jgi:hypothetical protein
VSSPPSLRWPWVVAALLVTVPLALDPGGRLPFLPPKEALVLAGVSLLPMAVVADRLARWWARGGRGEGAPRGNLHLPSFLLLLLFWAWSVAAPLHRAPSPALHLDAALSLSALVGLSLATALAVSADPGWRRRMVLALALSAAGVTAHGLLQVVGWDPLALLGAAPQDYHGRWRLFTTAGNPNWTAGYLAITAPLLAWALLQPPAGGATPGGVQGRRLLQVLAWSTVLAVVLAAGSRLGALALAAAGVGWVYALRAAARGPRPFPAWLWALGTLAVAAALSLGARATGGLLHRWGDLGSLMGRGFHLLAGLRLVEAAPVTGHGLSQSGLLLPEAVRELRPGLGPGWEPWVPTSLLDQLPSELVETAAGSGLVGLLLLVALWVVAVRRTAASRARALGRHRPGATAGSTACEDTLLEGALGASLLAFAVLTVGSAPLRNPMMATPFFVITGFVAGGVGAPGVSGALASFRTPAGAGARKLARALGFAAAVALPMLALPRAVHLVQGNRAAAQAREALERGDLKGAEGAFRVALELTPRSHEAAVFLAGLLLERGEPGEALVALDLAAQGGASPEEWLLRADALRQRGELPAALDVLDRAVAILPNLVRAHFLRGEVLDELGDLEAARLAYRNVVERAGRFPAAEPWAELARGRLAVIEAWDG